jgi:hypothetical protein
MMRAPPGAVPHALLSACMVRHAGHNFALILRPWTPRLAPRSAARDDQSAALTAGKARAESRPTLQTRLQRARRGLCTPRARTPPLPPANPAAAAPRPRPRPRAVPCTLRPCRRSGSRADARSAA